MSGNSCSRTLAAMAAMVCASGAGTAGADDGMQGIERGRYLVAIMDWYSRYVLSHEVSTSLDSRFCITALEKALGKATPEIFNTDQGSQFTSKDFTGTLKEHDIKISMDGRGRCQDNIFIERLWWTIYYQYLYY